MEVNVLIGQKEMLPTRLIIDLMPEDVYQTRLKKAEKEAKKKGYQVSDEFKARAHFNLLITNIPVEDISSNQVYQLYKIRWQIELIFKIWKSTCGINKIHPMRYHRLMCLFYAKFLLIMINFQIINLLQRKFYLQFGRLLSKDKCFKTLTIYFHKIREALFSPKQKIALLIQSITCILSKNHWLEKRTKRVNYIDIFTLYIS
jgi:transposase